MTIPPWALAPLTIAPIACSRMPKGTLRPAWTLENSPAPSNTVLVDSTRSAAPPIIVGANSAKAVMTFCPAARVASFSPASNSGSASCQPSLRRPAQARSQSSAMSGKASRQASKRSATPSVPRLPDASRLMCS